MFGKLLPRIVTAVIALAIFIALIWVPALKIGFAIAVTVLCVVGLKEYYAMVRAKDIEPESGMGMFVGAAVAFGAYFVGHPFENAQIINAVLFAGCLIVCAAHVIRGHVSLLAIISSAFGILYVGWFSAHLVLMHKLPDGNILVSALFLTVIMTDTVAYFVGSAIGKHKLAPVVSPNKSWEGAIAGVLGAELVMAGLWYWQNKHPMDLCPAGISLWPLLLMGLVVSAASQIGDLTESNIKRSAGIKDSGTFFPGHGGVLDRCDGFLFAAPAMYYFLFVMTASLK